MSFPVSFLLALIGLIVSAKTRFHGIPVLWLLAIAVVLALAAVVLWLIRLLMQDRQRPAPQPVHVITSLH